MKRRALAIVEANYGPNHPDVATALNNLASLLQDTNRLAEAEPLMRRSLAIFEASYGPYHPDVAMRLGNLARLLQDANRQAEAEPLVRRALAIAEASYGPNHPEVATCLINLASLLRATNRLAEAEPLMHRALYSSLSGGVAFSFGAVVPRDFNFAISKSAASSCFCVMDLAPILRQIVKARFSLNGELSLWGYHAGSSRRNLNWPP